MNPLDAHNAAITACRACPRLIAWCEQVARDKKAAYRDQPYWGRPVPGFGDPAARLLLVGLAPAAHGANRTGRMFTGDRSGDWLYRALHKAGFASQPTSTARDDGQTLRDAYISAVVRCAPPGNKPLPAERDACIGYLNRDLDLLPDLRVLVCLGKFAWDGLLALMKQRGHTPAPAPAFGHGAETTLGPYHLLGSYHPSQQNTFTGKLTEPMLDAIFTRARTLLR
ncbi:MAG TPA: uracil-DNA glycosylase [Kiritimatiellia bacterium]|nr:uracil-DNA glycosylase [Kiritimatiellia bacterium]HMP35291.1 uracil-DNA glycosylase [Kiritimatiellia bacterium]